MMRKTVPWLCVGLLLWAFLFGSPCLSLFAEGVSLSSLLDEMLDRDLLVQYPEPFYLCKQASSFDRNSKSPAEKGWFANADASQFLREEINEGRREWVLMDAEGPGAIVRWWITAPHYKVNFRVYLDGKESPEITANIADLVGGKYLCDAPLSAEKARGRNLYLPIPFAKRIKITVDDMPAQGNLYYQINYRVYEPGTEVESFTMKNLQALNTKIDQVRSELRDVPVRKGESYTFTLSRNGGKEVIRETVPVPCMIRSFTLKVDAEDIPQALRSTLVEISFDGIRTIRVPLGDCMGGGVGINPYKSRYTAIEKDGTMHSFWIMPFKNKIEASFTNYDPDQDITVHFENVCVEPIEWTERTMYFFADWRQDREIETFREEEKKRDWNYIALKGRGVFVGDSLSVLNRSTDWWGEGDEKIYVDGETFPSHFGTGTEDYYGYAWCTPAFFESPFHAQPRAEGPNNFGHATNSRFRILDAIPFREDFRFDMEIWHWDATSIDYSVVCCWYGFPGMKGEDASSGTYPSDERIIEEIRSKVQYKTPYVFKMEGFEIKEMPPGKLSRQEMSGWKDGKWKDNDQLWWTETKPGDKLEFLVKLEKDGPHALICELTKARDYGRFQFSLDAKKIGEPVDLYNPEKVISTGPISIGTIDPGKGEHVLRVEVLEKNPDSAGTMFGIDAFRLEPGAE